MSGWSQLKYWKFRGCIVINNTDFPRKVTPLNSPSMVPSTAPSKVSFHFCHWNQEAWAFFPVRRYYVRACSVRSIYLWRMGTKSPYSLPLIKATGARVRKCCGTAGALQVSPSPPLSHPPMAVVAHIQSHLPLRAGLLQVICLYYETRR